MTKETGNKQENKTLVVRDWGRVHVHDFDQSTPGEDFVAHSACLRLSLLCRGW